VSDLIRVAEPDLSQLERDYLLKAFDSGWISSTGEFVDRFEAEWAHQCGSKYALSVANGTVALHLILAALDIGPGDEVIVPSLTFVASANAIRYVGAKPVFADSNLDTWCIDPASMESLITKNTKAVIAVHLYGNPADMDGLGDICQRYGIHLIEDAAEAPFAEINGQRIGSFGIAASFSFYGNKILTSGEGGAVTTSDFDLYRKMKLLRGQGMDPNRRYYFIAVGFNFRLTNLQCALLCAQLARSDHMIQIRRAIFKSYDSSLGNDKRLSFQAVLPGHSTSPWLYSFLVEGFTTHERDNLIDMLMVKGVETRPLFIPVHTLPPYMNSTRSGLQHAESIGGSGISLPTSSKLTIEVVEKIAEEFAIALNTFQ
jgi:perosamine synthetase